jgi:hypothetical protein
MSPQVERSLLWLPGPALAVALVAFAILGHGGPGFFFLSLVGGAAFMLGAPVLQLVLLSTPAYKGRYGAACRTALLIVLAGLFVPVFLGVFNFW